MYKVIYKNNKVAIVETIDEALEIWNKLRSEGKQAFIEYPKREP